MSNEPMLSRPAAPQEAGESASEAAAEKLLVAAGRMEFANRVTFERLGAEIAEMQDVVANIRAAILADADASALLDELDARTEHMLELLDPDAALELGTAAAGTELRAPEPPPEIVATQNHLAQAAEEQAFLDALGANDLVLVSSAELDHHERQPHAEHDHVPTVSQVVSQLGRSDAASEQPAATTGGTTVAMLEAMVEELAASMPVTWRGEPEQKAEPQAAAVIEPQAETIAPQVEAAAEPVELVELQREAAAEPHAEFVEQQTVAAAELEPQAAFAEPQAEVVAEPQAIVTVLPPPEEHVEPELSVEQPAETVIETAVDMIAAEAPVEAIAELPAEPVVPEAELAIAEAATAESVAAELPPFESTAVASEVTEPAVAESTSAAEPVGFDVVDPTPVESETAPVGPEAIQPAEAEADIEFVEAEPVHSEVTTDAAAVEPTTEPVAVEPAIETTATAPMAIEPVSIEPIEPMPVEYMSGEAEAVAAPPPEHMEPPPAAEMPPASPQPVMPEVELLSSFAQVEARPFLLSEVGTAVIFPSRGAADVGATDGTIADATAETAPQPEAPPQPEAARPVVPPESSFAIDLSALRDAILVIPPAEPAANTVAEFEDIEFHKVELRAEELKAAARPEPADTDLDALLFGDPEPDAAALLFEPAAAAEAEAAPATDNAPEFTEHAVEPPAMMAASEAEPVAALEPAAPEAVAPEPPAPVTWDLDIPVPASARAPSPVAPEQAPPVQIQEHSPEAQAGQEQHAHDRRSDDPRSQARPVPPAAVARPPEGARMPDPLAPLRALSDEERIALFE